MGNSLTTSSYNLTSSIIKNMDTINTDNIKFDKIIKYRYKSEIISAEIEKELENFNINTCDKDGKNLLHMFAYGNDFRVLQILLVYGCDINKKDKLGNTPIYYSNETNIKFFIDNGIDLNIKNIKGRTVLYEKSKYYYSNKAIKYLFSVQNYENIYDQFEKYEHLHKAVLFQDISKMTELMNENKFLVNTIIESPIIEDHRILTPLQIACENGLYDEFLCLLDYGADIHQTNLLVNISYSCTNNNQINIIKKLIEQGIDINQVDKNGCNVLHTLYFSGCIELFEIFLRAGTNVNTKNLPITFERTPLVRYVHKIESNATPLQSLSMYGTNKEIYKKFFEYDADPNIQNNYGINAFMGICNNEFFTFNRNGTDTSFEMIQLFVENGADIYLIDNFGNTVLDIIVNNPYITKENKTKIIKYLHEKFKLTPAKSKTNEFLYNVLVQDKIIE